MFNEQPIISKWIADLYDQKVLDTQDIDFLLSVLGPTPRQVLEIACGSGRLLVPMAKAGHEVTGLDFDECMLAKIPPKAEGLTNIRWHKADVIRDPWPSGFDFVVIAANFFFNIISDLPYGKAQQLLIEKSAAALVPGGSLYIDYGYTPHPEKWFANSKDSIIWEGTDSEGTTGRMSITDNSFDPETNIIGFNRRFELTLADGQILRQVIPSHKHFAMLDEIHAWLSAAGFTLAEEYGDNAKNPISDTTNRAIIRAVKA